MRHRVAPPRILLWLQQCVGDRCLPLMLQRCPLALSLFKHGWFSCGDLLRLRFPLAVNGNHGVLARLDAF